MTLLPALDGAVSNRIPIELQPLAVRLASEAVDDPNLNVVLFSDSNFNYSVQRYSNPVDYLAPRIAPYIEAPAPSSREFLFLRLPRLERDSAALHVVLLGHELGHLRDWINNISGSLDVSVPSEWLDDDGVVTDHYVPAVELHRALITNWASELVADIYGALTFGPASLTGLAELVLSIGVFDRDSVTHPGADRRTHFVLDVLERLGFRSVPELIDVLNEYQLEADKAVGRQVDLANITDQNDLLKQAADEAWKWLLLHKEGLIQACQQSLPAADVFEAARWDEVEYVSARLAQGQPCGERLNEPRVADQDEVVTLSPVAAAAILNACWLLRLRNFEGLTGVVLLDAADPRESGAIAEVLDGLVLKSLEIAEFRREEAWSWE